MRLFALLADASPKAPTFGANLPLGTSGSLLAGTEYDWLNVSGTANLGGTLDVSLIDLGGSLFNPALGDSFDIIKAAAIAGHIDLLTVAVLGNELDWDVSYIRDDFGTEFVRLSVVSAVPVSPSILLFGSGLLELVGISRRKESA